MSDTQIKTRVIAITGGKGGVGKTTIASNLAISLSRMGHSVLLMDADFGLANVDVMLGLRPKKDLSHVLRQQCELHEIFIPGPAGVQLIPSSSGLREMAVLGHGEVAGLIDLFSNLEQHYQYLIIDTAAGISPGVTGLLSASDEIITVVCNTPGSLTDTYALIKLMSSQFAVKKFRVLTNMVSSVEESHSIFAKLTKVTEHFLNVSLKYMGMVRVDSSLVKAQKRQQAVVELYPKAMSSADFRLLAKQLHLWTPSLSLSGQVQFFKEQIMYQDGVA